MVGVNVLVAVVAVVVLSVVVTVVVVKHSGFTKSPRSLLQLMKTDEPSLYAITWIASTLNWLFTTLVFSNTKDLW